MFQGGGGESWTVSPSSAIQQRHSLHKIDEKLGNFGLIEITFG